MTEKDESKELQELKRLIKWYQERCKVLEKENERLQEKVRAFYGF